MKSIKLSTSLIIEIAGLVRTKPDLAVEILCAIAITHEQDSQSSLDDRNSCPCPNGCQKTPPKRSYSTEFKEDFFARLTTGKTVRELSGELNVPYSTAISWLSRKQKTDQ